MQFGLCNAPATFQRMMNEILKEEIATGKVVCYIDDILIFMSTVPEHQEMTRRVLQKLDNRLYCKLEKCVFEQKSVEFLGMVISENSVAMSPDKLEAIQEWPVPCQDAYEAATV